MASRRTRGGGGADPSSSPLTSRGVLLLMMPSVTDINGAGGVAARWKEYKRELQSEGWEVELWTVDSEDARTKVPRYHLPNFPGTLTDSPGVLFMLKIWRRLNRPPLVASVVFGMMSSTLLLLLVLPAAYAIMEDLGIREIEEDEQDFIEQVEA